MSLTKCTAAVDNVSSLPDKPALTAAQLKAKFDKTGSDIKNYLNNTLTDELDAALGNKIGTDKIAIIAAHHSYSWEETVTINPIEFYYPAGFTKDNCICLALQFATDDTRHIGRSPMAARCCGRIC